MPEEPIPAFRPVSYEADRRLTIVETLLSSHVRECDRRAAMAQKLLWFGVTTNIAVLGVLLKLALSL